MVMEIYNTEDEFYERENYFTTFKYETLELTSVSIRSNIFLSSKNPKYRWSKMVENQYYEWLSENVSYNSLTTKNLHFHLCFYENFTLTQLKTVYILEAQECGIDWVLNYYNFFSSHNSPNGYMCKKGKECKEGGFGKKDRLLENQILPSFSLNFCSFCLKIVNYVNILAYKK